MIVTKQQKHARLTAKPLLAIVNATAKKSTDACVNGASKTVKKHGNTHANGATGNWQMQVLKKKQPFVLLKLLGQSVAKTGDATKFLPPMAAIVAHAAAKLSGCFCRSTTSIMTATSSVSLARIAAAARRSIFGCASTSSRQAIKCCA